MDMYSSMLMYSRWNGEGRGQGGWGIPLLNTYICWSDMVRPARAAGRRGRERTP